MGPVLVSYLRTVGEAGAAAGSAGSIGADDIEDNHVPWLREEGLARGRDEELWPPLVFSMTTI